MTAMNTALLACFGLALLTAPASAQKMGHSNTNAPTISQTIRLGDKGTIKLQYTSITWASGSFSKALQDENTRERLRERINGLAASDPLGSLETTTALIVDDKRVGAGSYALAFMLGADYGWQLVLTAAKGKRQISWPLELEATKRTSRRLTVNLEAGDEDFTAQIAFAFGNQVGRMAVATAAPIPEVAKANRGTGPIVNAKCPLMEEAVEARYTLDFNGRRVGFCCEDCLPDWLELSDAEKEQHLAKVLKK